MESDSTFKDLGWSLAKQIGGKILPIVGDLLLDSIKTAIFGAKPEENNLADVTKLLEGIDSTLKDIKEIQEYKYAFDKDKKYTDIMKTLNSTYDTYQANANSTITQDDLANSCERTNMIEIIEFYDRQLNGNDPNVIGDYIDKSWTVSKIKNLAKVYYLKMNHAAMLYAVCKTFLYSDQPDIVNSTLSDQNGVIKKSNKYIRNLQDRVEGRIKVIEDQYFDRAIKYLEGTGKVNTGTMDDICNTFYENAAKTYDHVFWTCVACHDCISEFYSGVADSYRARELIGEPNRAQKNNILIAATHKDQIHSVENEIARCTKGPLTGLWANWVYAKEFYNQMSSCIKDFAGAFIYHDQAAWRAKVIGPGHSYRCFESYGLFGIRTRDVCFNIVAVLKN